MSSAQIAPLFPSFPFGSDFSAEELRLLPALVKLKNVSASKLGLAAFLLKSLFPKSPPADAETLLARLNLQQPQNLRERLTRRMVLAALAVD